MAEKYDNTNTIALWVRTDKSGKKYLSILGNVDGIEVTGAAWKREVKEGSNQPLYSGVIGVKSDGEIKPVKTEDDADIPF